MSSGGAQVAVFGMRGQLAPDSARAGRTARVPVIRLTAFAVLGLYAAARWSELLAGGVHGRLVAVLGLGLLLAASRPVLADRSRVLAGVATALLLLVALGVAGIPVGWITHVRIAVTARAIGEGLSALPQALVPYKGVNPWVRLDIVLGGAVLLLDAALVLAFAPRQMSETRRAAAAVPLVALVAVPSTMTHSRSPYLDGMVLFLMLAAFVLGERISNRQASGALGLALITAVVAMLLAPALDRHKPWLDYWNLAGGLAPTRIDTFDWSQTYGPVSWPQHGRTVLEIKATRASYWKTQDLDVFDGRAWTQGVVPGQNATPAPSRHALATWSQTIEVTVRDMRSSSLIAAGSSARPAHLGRPVLSGFSLGTWTSPTPLEPGDSYTVRVYSPDPSASQLRSAGTDYASLAPGYRTILLTPALAAGGDASAQLVFPTFHSPEPVVNAIGEPRASGRSVVEHSAYASAYRLARRLAARAATPYAFVEAVKRFLGHGFTYTQTPRVRPYPLESFLFADRRGYCQQFAGAMALLLRMGGVPSRVSVGFTEGRLDAATGRWMVTDRDAHAWVEAWFPHYGWVRFDPTPAIDPALRDSTPITAPSGPEPAGAGTGQKAAGGFVPGSRAHTASAGPVRRRGGIPVAAIAAPTGAIALLTLGLLLVLTRPLGSVEAEVSELERALFRSGRTPSPETTLAQLEHQLRRAPAASEYVYRLRLARFGGADDRPTPAQRRALRRQLAGGRGPLRRLRALWALPPRRRPARRAAARSSAPRAEA
ncbi:MAG TPA: transglutaminaseTgpA domain-containing protein [Solirubrobacteraceae bacterium]|nr:transglutaminaseTgpA domain-containing protein [Solirubrobacteraceae bacterium]